MTATWETWTGHVELRLAPRMQSVVLQPHYRVHEAGIPCSLNLYLLYYKWGQMPATCLRSTLFSFCSHFCCLFFLCCWLCSSYHFLELFLRKGNQWWGRIKWHRWPLSLDPDKQLLGISNWWSDESIFCSGGMPLTAPLLCTRWLQVGARLLHMGMGNEKEQIDRWSEDGNFQTPHPIFQKGKEVADWVQ